MTPPAGGLDGFTVTFGDGCDADTAESFCGSLFRLVLRVQTADEFFDAAGLGFTYESGDFLFQYHPWNDETDEADETVTLTIPFAKVIGIQVY